MLPVFEKIMLVVQPIALAILLIYTYGLFSRAVKNPHVLNALMGGVFGLAAAMAMSAPIPIADGVIIDIRNLFIGIAAAFFGPLGGMVALLMGAAMRISIGGEGMMLGVAGMIVASIMGGLWALFLQPRIKKDLNALFVLALMISQHLVLGAFLPPAVRDSFFLGLGPTLLTANLIGTILLGKLIRRERALLAETHRLLDEATTDPLTKLVNRKTAATAFAALPPLRNRSLGQAMLCIDIDAFKGINDTYGHLYGDEVLIDVSAQLSACLRPDDILSRISGDEFVIVLHGVTAWQAKAIAERCRLAIGGTPLVADGKAIRVSISVGAVWTQLESSFIALREKADEALYHAKSNGRDCVAFEIDRFSEDFVESAVA